MWRWENRKEGDWEEGVGGGGGGGDSGGGAVKEVIVDEEEVVEVRRWEQWK